MMQTNTPEPNMSLTSDYWRRLVRPSPIAGHLCLKAK